MAQTIKIKRSATSGNKLTGSNSIAGEIGMNTADKSLYIQTGSTDASVVTVYDDSILHLDDTNNRVGIGTTSPAELLSVQGDISLSHTNGANPAHAGALYFRETGTTWGTDYYGFRILHDGSNNQLKFQGASTTFTNDSIIINRDTGIVAFQNTSNSTGTGNGAVRIAGGLGVGYNVHAGGLVRANSGFYINTTQIVDSSRNLVNIGTLSSTANSVTTKLNQDLGSGFRGTQLDATNATLQLKGGTNTFNIAALSSGLAVWDMTNGSYRLNILNNGNVGIGTTSPSQKLHVVGGGQFTNSVTVGDSTSDALITTGVLKVGLSGGTTVIDSSRNLVNIGTITSGAITASDSLASSTPLTIGSSSQTSFTYQQWKTSAHGAAEAYIIAYGAGHSTQPGNFAMKNLEPNGEIFFELAGSVEPLRFASNGGATFNKAFTFPTTDGSANQVLQTDGSGNVSWASVSSAGASDVIADADGDTKIQVEESADEDKIKFDTAGSQRMIIDETGKVGIGTTTPGEKLEVIGNVEAEEFIGDIRGATLFKASAGEALAKGDVVYISGISGNTTVVSKADADDAAKMPAFGIAAAAASANNPVDVYTSGILSEIDTSAFSEGDELFVSTTAGGLTATAPTGESAALQKIGKVTRSASSGSIFIIGAGRTNAVPNLNEGKLFVGNSSNQAVADDTVHVDIANSRVGINTTSPSRTFEIHENNTYLTIGEKSGYSPATYGPILETNSGSMVLPGTVYLANSNAYILKTGTSARLHGDGGVRFSYYNGSTTTEGMRLTNGGNLGIGTTSPVQKLDIQDGFIRVQSPDVGGIAPPVLTMGQINNAYQAGITSTVHLSMKAANSSGNFYWYPNTNTPIMTLTQAGNLGVGTTSPSEKLQVNGNIKLQVNGGQLRDYNNNNIINNTSNIINLGSAANSITRVHSGVLEGESPALRLRNMTALPGGYIESDTLNFRFDESATAYAGESHGIGGTINQTTGTAITDANLKRLFSYTASYINLNTHKDASNNVVIELDGISVSNSANTSWKPYVFFHSGAGNVATMTVEVKNGSGTWETVENAIDCVDFYIRDGFYITSSGILKGARFTFTNITGNAYLRMIGVIGKTHASYQWNVLKSGGKMFGDLDFGDSKRLTFGNSEDLRIYHDGSNSWISETGTGSLIVGADNYYLRNAAGNETKISAISNAGVGLYYDNTQKFATTTSGAAVTGGLSITGGVNMGSNTSAVFNFERNTGNYLLAQKDGTGSLTIGTGSHLALCTGQSDGDYTQGEALRITSAGDVGIGDTTPSYKLDVNGTGRFTGAVTLDSTLSFSFATATTALNLNNNNIIGVNSINMADPGPNEGINWSNIKIYESPNDLTTNSSGNFQVVYGSTRRLTVDSGGVEVNGYLRGPATFTIDPAAHGDDTGTVVIAGNLQVDGTTTTINSTTLTVDDKNITLASGAANAAAASGAGITVDAAGAQLTYDATQDRWNMNRGLELIGTPLVVGTGTTDVGRVENSSGVFSLTAYTGRQIAFGNDTNGEHVRIDANGNVGIGTNTPSTQLHISSTSTSTLTVQNTTNAGNASLHFRDESNVDQYKVLYDLPNNRAEQHFNGNGLRFYSTQISAEVAKIGFGNNYNTSYFAGRVGIGTSSPSADLHVDGSALFTGSGTYSSGLENNTSVGIAISKGKYLFSDDGNYARSLIGHNTNNDIEIGQGNTALIRDIILAPGSSGNIRLNASGVTDFFVGSGGNVGVGTTVPTNHLAVNSSSNGEGIDLLSNNTKVGSFSRMVSGSTVVASLDGVTGRAINVGGSVNTSIILGAAGGNVGVGTTSPNARFQVEEAGIDTTTTSTTATTQVAIDTFAAATFRSARYTIQVTNSTDSTYHITEILLIHDGTTPQITEYGTIFTGSAEATFDADISSGNVRLLATPASTDSMTFKVVRHCITV